MLAKSSAVVSTLRLLEYSPIMTSGYPADLLDLLQTRSSCGAETKRCLIASGRANEGYCLEITLCYASKTAADLLASISPCSNSRSTAPAALSTMDISLCILILREA